MGWVGDAHGLGRALVDGHEAHAPTCPAPPPAVQVPSMRGPLAQPSPALPGPRAWPVSPARPLRPLGGHWARQQPTWPCPEAVAPCAQGVAGRGALLEWQQQRQRWQQQRLRRQRQQHGGAPGSHPHPEELASRGAGRRRSSGRAMWVQEEEQQQGLWVQDPGLPCPAPPTHPPLQGSASRSVGHQGRPPGICGCPRPPGLPALLAYLPPSPAPPPHPPSCLLPPVPTFHGSAPPLHWLDPPVLSFFLPPFPPCCLFATSLAANRASGRGPRGSAWVSRCPWPVIACWTSSSSSLTALGLKPPTQAAIANSQLTQQTQTVNSNPRPPLVAAAEGLPPPPHMRSSAPACREGEGSVREGRGLLHLAAAALAAAEAPADVEHDLDRPVLVGHVCRLKACGHPLAAECEAVGDEGRGVHPA